MDEILVAQQGAVLELQLNRPAKKNALTLAMYGRLIEAMQGAERDASVRAILFGAVGEAFTAGNDIADFLAATGDPAALQPPLRFIETLASLTKPLIAAVHGAAVGVGATMLLHCDLVYASESARLSMPFVSLGLVPEAASSLLLPQRIGQALANEMLLLGTALDAQRALRLGLINELVTPASALLEFARDKARQVAAKPPRAVQLTKALLRADRPAVLARIEEEGRQFAALLAGPEAREAFTAFLERRAPDFTKFAWPNCF